MSGPTLKQNKRLRDLVAALEGFLAGAHEENSSLKNQLSEAETHLFMAKEENRGETLGSSDH